MSGIVNDNPIASSRQSITFATGTKMIFNQTAAPTGWTKVTGIDDDQALRVTTGTVGTGGDVNFETAFASQTPTISRPTATSGTVATHPISIAELPAHDHEPGGDYHVTDTSAGGYVSGSTFNLVNWPASASQGSGTAHGHGFTQPTISIPTSSAIDLNVKFVDIIIATKD